ncbi:MAG: hypothetical protein K8R69_12500 [Deltaproteobacteria bacterium]|nr:hypothetical protein [Deltaproteobacteria bacterium]
MQQSKQPNILDVTVRDGGYLINHNFTPEKVAQIAKGLSDAGISHAEISHGVGIGGKMIGFPAIADDEELLSAAKQAAPDLKLSVFVSPIDIALPILPGLLEYFEIGRVGVNVNQVVEAAKYVQKLKKYEKKVSIQLTRCHALPPEETVKAAKAAEELGADIVYVVDTFGSMFPEEARDYVAAVRAEIKVEVGFHGHNTMGLAIPNSMAAWEAGASWLDASLMGVGRGAGNANLEALVFLLQGQGLKKDVRLDKLCEASSDFILPLFLNPPSIHYTELLLSQEKIDFTPASFLDLCSNAAGVPLENFLMEVHHKMGASLLITDEHLRQTLQEYGIDYQKLLEVLKH